METKPKSEENKERKRSTSKSSSSSTDPSECETDNQSLKTKGAGSELSPSDKSDDTIDMVYRSTTKPNKKWKKDVLKSWCSNMFHFKEEMSLYQLKILFMILFPTLTTSLTICLFPPFFPKLAESKGTSQSIYSLIIGVNCLVSFFVSPIIGDKIEHIGVKFSFVMGVFSSGVCCILSGYLEYFPAGLPFMLVAVAIRVVHATSNAGVITATIAIITFEFRGKMGRIFALSRAATNLAQMFGPALGGLLYEQGGFHMPFLVIGLIQIGTALFCLAYLSSYTCVEDGKRQQNWSMFLIPGMWVSFVTFIFSTMSNGFLSVSLEPNVVRQFNLREFYLGLVFGLKDGANCIASIMWGWIGDKKKYVRLIILIGTIMATTSFILLGPFPGLPLHHTLGIVLVALVLNGFGIGGQQVGGFLDAMDEAVDAGYPDNAQTSSFVASLWSALSGIGRFSSRAVSGLCIDHIGFRWSSSIVVTLHLIIMLITIIFVLFGHKMKRKIIFDYDNDGFDNERSVVITRDGKVNAYSPSEPVSVKIPNIRDDLEDSFAYGSAPHSKPQRYRPRESIAESP